MAKPSPTTINCPSCGQPFSAIVEQILDTRIDPSVKERLISGRVNMITCPSCGYQGLIGTPLLYHDHDNQLAIVYAPMELNIPETERERIIGMMTQAVMRSLPEEAAKGYLLQPRTALTMQGLIDQVLEVEGITPEVIEKERRKADLIATMLESDVTEQDRLISENADLFDETFFEMLALFSQQASASGDSRQSLRMLNLRNRLMENTPFGQELKEREAAAMEAAKALQDLGEDLSRESFIDLVIGMADNEYKIEALGIIAASILDYQTFELLTAKIDAEADSAKKAQLEDAREKLLTIASDMEKQTQAVFGRAVETLKAILAAPDVASGIRQHAARIDEAFLQVLQANLDEARRTGNIEVSRKLGLIEEEVLAIIRESAPPEIQMINDLLTVEDDEASLALLRERKDEINEELLELLESLGQQLADAGNIEAAERLRKLHQAASTL